jgi:mitochondrial intermediate peptidase
MQKALRRQPWTCANCLRIQRRWNSTVTDTPPTQDTRLADAYIHVASKSTADNNALREVFNSQSFWRDFSHSAKRTSGLIGNKHLTTPKGFQTFAETSLKQCKKLVDRTLAASTPDEFRALPRDLDRLSDLLCRVIDLSDFIRSNHPDARVAAAATASYSIMLQYMNQLNTTTGLNDQLKKAWAIADVRSQWTEEENMVAQILMKDFAKSGIDLPEKQRKEFVLLSNEIAEVGTDFTTQMEPSQSAIIVQGSQLEGLKPTLLQNFPAYKKIRIPIYSPTARAIMSSAHNPEVRKELYMAERTASKRTIAKLEQLLLRRAELAKLTGYSNFAQMTLADKMSKTPEAVGNFLQSLHNSNRGQVQSETAELSRMLSRLTSGAAEVNPWDHNYLLNQLYRTKAAEGIRTSKSRLRENAKAYFALGHVMQGLSRLFQSLYGIRFVPKATQIGEVWDPEVRRLDVQTESGEHIATMYCDLFSRPGKPPNPAHFTLMCSRQISEEEIEDCSQTHEPLNYGMPTLLKVDLSSGNASHYQIPVIALVCDFPDTHTSTDQPSLLSINSVITLFHEMGHAVHSFLGRTSMQGIAGTRCPTDFAELPSILMEYFAMNPEVLKLFACHWKTGETIPDELIQALRDEQKSRAETSGGWDNENQILMAMLDQVYHSSDPVASLASGKYDSTAAYHQVWDKYASSPEPHQTAWQGFFGHLYGYGATYYSYLFDRAIARQVWRAVFRDGENAGGIDRAAGQRFSDQVLRWGGGKDPWHCLEGLMGQGRGVLAEGGHEAMLEVGRWGIDAGTEGQM